ncbi:hypothetical protein HWV62_34123 [Athelia sp. TMB]|nr:hypothetical protein HWV62_34123 [Athelia sp. TMB]
MDYKPRRSMDIPKPAPETGLAEWTSKIKAMQRQVDEDDEAEQHKLEAEIAASRLARQRRSYGIAAGSRLDIPQDPEPVGLPRNGPGVPIATDDAKSSIDRMNDREEAVRKLLGSRGVSSPTRNSIDRKLAPPAPAQPNFQAQPATRPDGPISLASFMGGRATGPRLNRHAPQQDAHDPTQFEQRSGRNEAPHPIFGRGGVAMPGMTGRDRITPEISSRDTRDRSRPEVTNNTSPLSPSPPSPSPASMRTEESMGAPAAKPLEEFRNRKRGTSISSGTSNATSSYSQTRSTAPEAARQAPDTTANVYGDYRTQDRGLSTSSSATTRAKGPYSPSEETSNIQSGSLNVYGRRDTYSRSASPNASMASGYSRGKTPEPTTPKPTSRPASRSGTSYYPSPTPSPTPEARSSSPPVAKSVSLAAFMGGRASGPRLNRPAPQQDAHDPTQFAQNRDFSSPHPLFGRGGVAMPGMTAKETSSEKYRASEERRDSAYGARNVVARYEQMASSTSATVPNTTRERTLSTPAWRNSAPVQGDYMKHQNLRRPTSQANLAAAATVSDAASSSSPNLSTPYTPPQPAVSPPQRSLPVTTPSLARPIQPLPKQLPNAGPQIPASKNPSRAFLRAPQEKEATPSLTRLKGRGFVQNMVKTSSQLQANVNEFGASPPPFEKPRPRSSSVLDRWQSAVSPSQTAPPTPISPKPMVLRKTRTVDAPLAESALPATSTSTKPLDITKPLKARASLPSMSHTDPPPRPSSRASSSKQSDAPPRPSSRASSSKHSDIPTGMPPQNTPGLGSSSTLISYIKPNKTGDNPAPLPESSSEGGRAREEQRSSERPASSGPPLKHPTKGRAKKPQKQSNPSRTVSELPTRPQAPVIASKVAFPVALSKPTPRSISPPESQPVIAREAMQSQPPLKSARVTDRWSNQAIIGVKPVSSSINSAADPPADSKPYYGLIGRQALPGLTTPRPDPLIVAVDQTEHLDRSPATPLSPGRHPRIPSTGNRATVMDVAQSLNDALVVPAKTNTSPDESSEDEIPEVPETLAEVSARPRNLVSSPGQGEKRRSSYDRFSAIMLPTLREEKTPAPSPAVTLTRTQGEASRVTDFKHHIADEPRVATGQLKDTPPALPDIFQVDTSVGPLPNVDIGTIKKMRIPPFSPDPNEITISVDVLRIAGNSATALLSDEMDVFYDTEVLAIVHRFKSKSSGLVATRVWSWQGQASRLADAGAQKLQELCKRYGTNLVSDRPFLLVDLVLTSVQIEIAQFREPAQLLHLLGGKLAVRQGVRAHWSSENTAMHSVRSTNGSTIIQEHELSVANLCSGFSYCLTILDTLYVWHGRGSRKEERDIALKYAQVLAGKGSNVVRLVEGESDDDEMFWMMLGEDDYAKADYWQWRKSSPDVDPRIWRVDSQNAGSPCQLIPFIASERLHTSVYILDCVWEYFVLVGKDARGKRDDISLAITIAQELSISTGPERPFNPTTHVIILPSQIPMDIQMHFHDFSDVWMNPSGVPDHMNLLSHSEALQQLQNASWDRTALNNLTMLPLGIDPSMLS